jgi:hypothetical protein
MAAFCCNSGMKVVGIIPRGAGVQIAFVVGTADGFEVRHHDEWVVRQEEGRLDDYVQIRTRLIEHLRAWQPDYVCIAPLEPAALKFDPEHPERRPTMAMFRTAELRGVVAEASTAFGAVTEFRVMLNEDKSSQRDDQAK